jgi:Thaumarchaeal output domain 1
MDLSPKGIGLELEAPANFLTTSLVLLLSGPDGNITCAGIEVRYTQANEAGRLRVGGPFGGFGAQILLAENLKPTFQRDTLEYSLGLPEELLIKWAEAGVLRSVLLDRVQLCPKCHGLPTFRAACPTCGSAVLTNDQLIHHFACAHVGLVSDFEAAGELICPKCRTNHLVVGSDYEYCTGPYRCSHCHWSDTELEQVAQCLRCDFRFPGYQAYQQELTGYLVRRLDPLALLSSLGFDPERCQGGHSSPNVGSHPAPHDVEVPLGLGA